MWDYPVAGVYADARVYRIFDSPGNHEGNRRAGAVIAGRSAANGCANRQPEGRGANRLRKTEKLAFTGY